MITRRLPLELIGRIAELLPRRDLHQCIFVDRTLHIALIPMLYRTVFVTTAANGFNSLGRFNGAHVRQLIMEDEVLSPEDTQTLCSLCPNLTELEYIWSNKDITHTTAPATSSSSYFPRSPPLLLQYMADTKRLVSLRLSYRATRETAEDVPIATVYTFFFSLLCHLPPRLCSLSLIGLLPILRVTDLEAIHMACPSLAHLTVEGSNMVLAPRNAATTCHPDLKSLRIAYPSGWSQVSQWIYLIFTHYPNIKALELVNTSGECTVLRPLAADTRLTDTLTYPQHLSELRFLKLGAYDLDWMMPLTHLHALVDVEIQSDRDWDMVPWLMAICDRLKRLKIRFPREKKDEVLQTLGKFRHLTDLTLIITSTLSLFNFFRLGCPSSLRRLSIFEGCIDFDTDPSKISSCPDSNNNNSNNNNKNKNTKVILSASITHLSLHNVSVIGHNTLDNVVAGCPLLASIEAFSCVWTLTLMADQQNIRFDFGQRQLNLLNMTSSSIANHQRMEPYEIQRYQFDLSSPTTTTTTAESPSSAPLVSAIERTGCKRIRDVHGQQETPFFVTFAESTLPQVNNHIQKTRRKTGLHTYTVKGSLKKVPWCMTIKCKSIKKLCINGHQL